MKFQPKPGLGIMPIMLIYHFDPAAVLMKEVDPGPWAPVLTN